MKCLDRHSLDEQTRLVSRYVAGDLSRSERAEFEAWLVASPELAAEVEMERSMRRGIDQRGSSRLAQAPGPGRGFECGSPLANGRRRERGGRAGHCRCCRRDAGTRVRQAGARLSAGTSGHSALPRTVRLGSMRGLGTSPDVTFVAPRCPRRAHHRAQCRGAHLRRRFARTRMPRRPRVRRHRSTPNTRWNS